MKKSVLEIGRKYGRLTIVREVDPHILPCGQKKRKVLCECDCGKFIEVQLGDVRDGHTKSCGCLNKEEIVKRSTTHSLSKHPLYSVWESMKTRCFNKNRKQFKDYGGRGITVCDIWLNDFKSFCDFCIKNGWKKGLVIDRIKVNGNYEPENIRFIDDGLSARNTRLLMATNKSGYRGVSWSKSNKKWIAQISINNKQKRLGLFDSLGIAALCYDAEAFLLDDGRPMNFIERE